MCKPSRLLSLWINVSIIFSGQINEAEEWAMNGKKKEKKKKAARKLTRQALQRSPLFAGVKILDR